MKSYSHTSVEKKWLKKWGKNTYKTPDSKENRQNFYLLTEFPYPSGNLHVGHWYAFSVPDIFARYLRMKGKNVLFPIGFDAFGLPAENAALKHGLNPRKWTEGNIAYMRKQLASMGASFDWSREVVTCAPEYYKWTQWLFLQLFKRGLAYRKKTFVNWCPSCKTVLANEQVKDEKCERCGTVVEQRQMEQWNLKITEYAERLLSGLEKLDWPEPIKEAQRNWIGKSNGSLIKFKIKYNPSPALPKGKGDDYGYYSTDAAHFRLLHEKAIEMRENPTDAEQKLWSALKGNKSGFHFRQQHIIGPFIVDFACLSRSLVIEVDGDIHDLQKERDDERNEMLHTLGFNILRFSNEEIVRDIDGVIERIISTVQKLPELKVLPFGEDLGGVVFKEIEIFTTRADTIFGASFVALAPTHPLAKEAKNIRAINPANGEELPVFVADYVMDDYGTGAVMGVPAHDERDKIFALENNLPIKNEPFATEEQLDGIAKKTISYKLRDWTVSRQRYWGVPIPVVKCEKCGYVPVKEKDLPVKLPEIKDYKPTGDGESPLAKVEKWKSAKCPQCGGKAERETDTLDTFVDSSWYFLRYTDPKNKKEFALPAKMKNWMPVNFYSGGAEHTTMHLLYSRFWHKALFDCGLVADEEPYVRRMNRGLILGPDNQKMSKSRGNVIDPDKEVERLGSDAVRMYLAFIGPYNEVGSYPWNPDGAVGVRRFLERVWRLGQKTHPQPFPKGREKNNTSPFGGGKEGVLLNHTIKKVGEAIESFKMNTGVSALMILLNEFEKHEQVSVEDYKIFLRLLAPFAPFITEELWAALGNKKSIHQEQWPAYDPKVAESELITIIVQVNGKVRGSFSANRNISESDAFAKAESLDSVSKHISGKEVKKRIFVKDKLVSFVAK